MKKHIITHVSILNMQVCSTGTIDEALEFAQREHEAGTQNNWQKSEKPELAPVTCLDHADRTHYVFVC